MEYLFYSGTCIPDRLMFLSSSVSFVNVFQTELLLWKQLKEKIVPPLYTQWQLTKFLTSLGSGTSLVCIITSTIDKYYYTQSRKRDK